MLRFHHVWEIDCASYIKLTEFIYCSLNEKSNAFCVLLDLRKSFDTVNHEVLLNKFYLYGVRGVPLALIVDYLRERAHALCKRIFYISGC